MKDEHENQDKNGRVYNAVLRNPRGAGAKFYLHRIGRKEIRRKRREDITIKIGEGSDNSRCVRKSCDVLAG